MTKQTSRPIRAAATVAIAACLTASALHATVVVPADLVDLTVGAHAIVHGRVVAVESRWTGDRRRLESLVRLEAADYLKGDLGATLTFMVPGGELGHDRTVFVGAPTFRTGDEVVLFLASRGPSIPYVLGLSQGVFRIVPGASGEKLVVPPALLRAADVQRVRRGDPARRPVPVAEFARTIGQVLAERVR